VSQQSLTLSLSALHRAPPPPLLSSHSQPSDLEPLEGTCQVLGNEEEVEEEHDPSECFGQPPLADDDGANHQSDHHEQDEEGDEQRRGGDADIVPCAYSNTTATGANKRTTIRVRRQRRGGTCFE
jgi:hypothetical protein